MIKNLGLGSLTGSLIEIIMPYFPVSQKKKSRIALVLLFLNRLVFDKISLRLRQAQSIRCESLDVESESQ